MASLSVILCTFIAFTRLTFAQPTDGNDVKVWDYIKSKDHKLANHQGGTLGEMKEYNIKNKIGNKDVIESWERTPQDWQRQLQRWGVEIKDVDANTEVMEATVDVANNGMINNVYSSANIRGKQTMNHICDIFDRVEVAKVGLHDVADVKMNNNAAHTEDLALLQAYKGKGYSWYNQWKLCYIFHFFVRICESFVHMIQIFYTWHDYG